MNESPPLIGRLGFRTQLFLISSFVLLLVLSLSGVYLEQVLRGWIEGQLEEQLRQQARAAELYLAEATSRADAPPSPTRFQGLVERWNETQSARLTLFDVQGCPYAATSPAAGEGCPVLPEVQRALAVGMGGEPAPETPRGAGRHACTWRWRWSEAAGAAWCG